MAEYSINLFTYSYSKIKIGDAVLPIAVFDLDIGEHTLAYQDVIHFSESVREGMGAMMKGYTLLCGVGTTNINPLNPWGLGTVDIPCMGGLADATQETASGSDWFYSNAFFDNPNGKLNFGGWGNSFYTSYGKYRVSPVIMFRNKFTGKYIHFTSGNVPWIYYEGNENPGIISKEGLAVGNIMVFQYMGTEGSLDHTVYEEITITDILDANANIYEEGGTSEPGGGDGNFDFESTDIPFSPLPAIGAYDTGFISLYKPNAGQLKNLAAYMWSGAFDIENFRKIVADPMSAILGLSIIPCTATAPATTSAELKVGNISTGISMPRCTEQYYDLNCGKINISPKWGAYLDFSPYSKLTLYLPYIGYVPLSPDDCMNGSVEIRYKIDILSGSCVVEVRCVSNRGKDAHVLYTFNGNCSCACPVTNGQYTNGAVGILHAASAITQAIGSGNILGGVEEAANTAISMVKPDITRSGEFGGSAGLLGNQYPYLILTVPRMCTPENQNKYIGYPSFITKTIGELTGYNKMSVTHLEGMSATEEECNEIINILESGVII